MIKNTKRNWKIIFIVAAIIIAVGGVLALALLLGSKGKDTVSWQFPDYTDDYENNDNRFVSQDSKVKFDGILDDVAWENQKWLDLEMNSDKNIRVKMTSYFGEDGLYMAFDVDDVGVYYNLSKGESKNSGIQLYISSMNGADSIEGYGYELMLSAAETVSTKIYQDGAYVSAIGKVYVATKLKGELNSSECKGYTMEAYIDYNMLDDECESVYAMPAIVRSFSKDSDERQWYCFGVENRAGTWTRGSSWWTFDKTGLVACDVSVKTDGNGRLDGKDYVPYGDDHTVGICPNEGYYAKSIVVNGKDMTDEIFYESGKAYYASYEVKDNLEIVVDFEKLPENVVDVYGKISDGSKTVDGTKAWVVKNGFSQVISVDAEGKYAASVPALDGLKIYAEASGCIPRLESLKEGGGEKNLVLHTFCFGSNADTGSNSSDMRFWDTTRLYENQVRLMSLSSQMQLVNSEIYSSSIYVSSNIKTNAGKGYDTRAGFSFYDNSGNHIFLSLTMSGEVTKNNPNGDISTKVQAITMSSGGTSWESEGFLTSFADQNIIRAKAGSEEGIPVAVHYCKGVFDVWVNGEQIGMGIAPVGKDGKRVLSSDTKMAVGVECWKSKAIYKNLSFDGNYPLRDENQIPGWDLTNWNQGIAKSLAKSGINRAILINEYSNEISISGKFSIPLTAGKDGRAGFCFENKQGEEVFVALTMRGQVSKNNPDGKLYYLIEIISDNMSSYSYTGTIMNISTWADIKTLASSDDGVTMSVYVKDGMFTVGINGYLVAEGISPKGKDGKATFDNDTKLKAGLETVTQETTFKNIVIGGTKPVLQEVINPLWDLAKLDKGEVSLTEISTEKAILWTELRDKYYLTSKVVLAPSGKDVRSGYTFEYEDGTSTFVCLVCEADGRYKAQVVNTVADGTRKYLWSSSYLKDDKHGILNASSDGIPFGVSYNNGTVTIWVNDVKVGTCVAAATEKRVSAGLECWGVMGKFYELAAYDKK